MILLPAFFFFLVTFWLDSVIYSLLLQALKSLLVLWHLFPWTPVSDERSSVLKTAIPKKESRNTDESSSVVFLGFLFCFYSIEFILFISVGERISSVEAHAPSFWRECLIAREFIFAVLLLKNVFESKWLWALWTFLFLLRVCEEKTAICFQWRAALELPHGFICGCISLLPTACTARPGRRDAEANTPSVIGRAADSNWNGKSSTSSQRRACECCSVYENFVVSTRMPRQRLSEERLKGHVQTENQPGKCFSSHLLTVFNILGDIVFAFARNSDPRRAENSRRVGRKPSRRRGGLLCWSFLVSGVVADTFRRCTFSLTTGGGHRPCHVTPPSPPRDTSDADLTSCRACIPLDLACLVSFSHSGWRYFFRVFTLWEEEFLVSLECFLRSVCAFSFALSSSSWWADL